MAAVLLAGAVLAALLVNPGAANAATNDGRDPISTGCANTAITAQTLKIWSPWDKSLIGWVDLRYSVRCKTTWARLHIVSGRHRYDVASIVRDTDERAYICVPTDYDAAARAWWCYTPMVDDNRVTSHAEAMGDDSHNRPFWIRTPSY